MILYKKFKTKLSPENIRLLKSLGYEVFFYNNKRYGRYSRRYKPY